jgi:hypothetical protein
MELGPYPVTGRFVEQDELKLMADEGARGLYDILLTQMGKPYFSTDLFITTIPGTSFYALPQDFYQLTGLTGIFNQLVFDIFDYNASEIAMLQQLTLTGGYLPTTSRYSINGAQSVPGIVSAPGARRLRIFPVPNQVFILAVNYVPACVRADDTTDEVYYDGVSGWEEWIIWDCVAKMLAKQESDASFAMASRAAVEVRIRGLAGGLDRLHPERAQDWQGSRRVVSRYGLGGRRWRL